MLRLALPNKGRLADAARSLVADAGLEPRASSERALVASLGGEYEALFVRAQDIPELVADGAVHAGITGWDLVSESARRLESRLDLGFGRCRIVVAVREESPVCGVAEIPRGTRVATVFPRIARRFFAEVGACVEIVPVTGAAEVAPHVGIADMIVDITSTGSTMRVNGLREIATVLESSARLVTRAAAADSRDDSVQASLDDLVAALRSVIDARSRRYLMANVPRARLAEVRDVLPGISGPTVIDVLDGGTKVAVHAVCLADGIHRTVNALKALGGEGILVTRIERLLA